MNMFSYHFPFRPRVRLTSFCNQKCKYCFAVDYLSSQEQNKEIPLTNLEDILIMCKNEGIKYIAWQGGEPLLHSKLHDIIQLHKKYCIKAMIFTNGIFESEIIKQLEPIVHSVLVNCNAPDTYSRKDLDTIYRNVSLMKELFGDNRVAIGINIYSEDLDTRYILGYAHDMNVKEVRVDITRPAPSHTNSFIDFNKVSIMFHKAYSTVKMLYDNGIIKVHFDCPFPLCLLSDDEKLGLWNFMYDDLKVGQCRTYLDITTNMNVSSCFCSIPFVDIPLSFFSSLTHAWQFICNIEDDLRWNEPTKESCKTCIFWNTHKCQGGCLGYKVSSNQYIDKNYINSHQDLVVKSKAYADLFVLFHKGCYTDYISKYETIKSSSDNILDHELLHLYIISRLLTEDVSVSLHYLKKNLHNNYNVLSEALDYARLLYDNGRTDDAVAIAYEGISLAKDETYRAYKLYEFLSRVMPNRAESQKYLIQYYKSAPLAVKKLMLH